MWSLVAQGPEHCLVVAEREDAVVCAKGMSVNPDVSFERCPPLDYLLVPGGRGTRTEVDNERTLYLKPLMFHRRKLHEILPKRGGSRRPYGGTMSAGIKRGTLVKHPKWGLTYVGGTDGNRVSLHHINTGKRLCQNAKVEDLKLYTTIKYLQEPAKAGAFLPRLKHGVSCVHYHEKG